MSGGIRLTGFECDIESIGGRHDAEDRRAVIADSGGASI